VGTLLRMNRVHFSLTQAPVTGTSAFLNTSYRIPRYVVYSVARWRSETKTTRVLEAVIDAVRQGRWATSGWSVIALLMVRRAVVAAVAASTVGGRLS
jgi:DNA invertase Pin-like site-specific DNA recombinase